MDLKELRKLFNENEKFINDTLSKYESRYTTKANVAIYKLMVISVPFAFDVHSVIFSDDAVGLEQKLHNILSDKRVNKINLRKEFFNTTIDDLEKLVQELNPTAEFNRTMIAEQYRQTLAINNEENMLSAV